MQWMRELFTDVTGQISAMRVLACIVVVDAMCTWTLCCLRNGWQDMGAETAGLIVGVLCAKAWQRKTEKS